MALVGKQRALAAARRLGVLPVLDAVRYFRCVRESAVANKQFLAEHPDFAAPPLWWMHDMYRHTSFDLYWRTGGETAKGISEKIDAFARAPRPRVADWGCGLGRVIRRLPENYVKTGFDYNSDAIEWCDSNIPDAEFYVNALDPPLPADDGAFDAVYALSVFTHLSEARHHAWLAEMRRILAPDGIFVAAFHMTPGAGQLLPEEQARFDAGKLVVRAHVKEGSRTFTAHHPEPWLRSFFEGGFELLADPEPFFGQTLFTVRRR